MSVVLRRTNLTRAPLSRIRSLLVLNLVLSLANRSTLRAQPPNEYLSRLGFTYDPKIHDAAPKKTALAADTEGFTPPGVLRLPKYTVVEKSQAIETNSLLTPKGRVELAEKRTLAPIYQKTIGPLMAVASLLHNLRGGWNPNAPEAMALYEDIKQRDRNNQMADLNDLNELADLAKQAEAPAGPNVKKPRKR